MNKGLSLGIIPPKNNLSNSPPYRTFGRRVFLGVKNRRKSTFLLDSDRLIAKYPFIIYYLLSVLCEDCNIRMMQEDVLVLTI